MTPAQKRVLFDNTARAMGDAKMHIKQRYIGNCAKADPAYGKGVADAIAKLAKEVDREWFVEINTYSGLSVK